jgi:hypothetical protein
MNKLKRCTRSVDMNYKIHVLLKLCSWPGPLTQTIDSWIWDLHFVGKCGGCSRRLPTSIIEPKHPWLICMQNTTIMQTSEGVLRRINLLNFKYWSSPILLEFELIFLRGSRSFAQKSDPQFNTGWWGGSGLSRTLSPLIMNILFISSDEEHSYGIDLDLLISVFR